jgi:hypothetical protein
VIGSDFFTPLWPALKSVSSKISKISWALRVTLMEFTPSILNNNESPSAEMVVLGPMMLTSLPNGASKL